MLRLRKAKSALSVDGLFSDSAESGDRALKQTLPLQPSADFFLLFDQSGDFVISKKEWLTLNLQDEELKQQLFPFFKSPSSSPIGIDIAAANGKIGDMRDSFD